MSQAPKMLNPKSSNPSPLVCKTCVWHHQGYFLNLIKLSQSLEDIIKCFHRLCRLTPREISKSYCVAATNDFLLWYIYHPAHTALYIMNLYHHEGLNEGCQVPREMQAKMVSLQGKAPLPTDQWSCSTHCLPPRCCLLHSWHSVEFPQGPGVFPVQCTRLGLPMFTAGMPLSPSKVTHGLWMRGGGIGRKKGLHCSKDPWDLLCCTDLFTSTLCHDKLEVSGALWGVVLGNFWRFSFHFLGKEKCLAYSCCFMELSSFLSHPLWTQS